MFRKTLPHAVGLAAGFDKDGISLDQWHLWGFAFVEVGTVTWHPQQGNPRPRLFRYPQYQAIVNRMGFNNEGAEALARRLDARQEDLCVGANIGKSKRTELKDAPAEYRRLSTLLAPRSDYIVINVSSPNTPGLRDLQDEQHIIRILDAVLPVARQTPVLVKIAPDMADEAIVALCEVINGGGAHGVVATNTTIARPFEAEAGGLSGEPLTYRACEVCQLVKHSLLPSKVVIGVGGIMTPDDAVARQKAGADLLQIYSGWIYNGPQFVSRIVEALIAEQG